MGIRKSICRSHLPVYVTERSVYAIRLAVVAPSPMRVHFASDVVCRVSKVLNRLDCARRCHTRFSFGARLC